MSCVVERTAEHAAVEKNLGEEKEPQVTSSTSTLDGKDMQLGGSEKTQVPVDTDEPTSEGGNVVIKKDQTKEHLMAVAEENDDSEKVKLQENKVKKRKRKELQQIKQEKMVNDAEKSHLTVYAQQPHLPCDAEQEHLLAVSEEDDDSDKVKLQEKKVKKIKQEKLFSDAQQPHQIGEPSSKTICPLRWCASYYTLLPRKYQKTKYKGSIILYPEENRVTLLDADETTIDARYLKEGDFIYPELVLKFPCHKAEIGKQILLANEIKLKKRKRSEDMAKEMSKKKQQPMSSPQAKLVGSSIGMFARVAALRKRMSPSVPTKGVP